MQDRFQIFNNKWIVELSTSIAMEKILLVDEKLSLRNSLLIGLRRNGYTVDSVNNAQNALFKLNDFHYDYLLTDINMPEQNGLALAEIAAEHHPNIRVILMTGYDVISNRIFHSPKNKFSTLAKPIKFRALLKLLRKKI